MRLSDVRIKADLFGNLLAYNGSAKRSQLTHDVTDDVRAAGWDEVPATECKWIADPDAGDWHTQCGCVVDTKGTHPVDDGRYWFCPYCGRPMSVPDVVWEEE